LAPRRLVASNLARSLFELTINMARTRKETVAELAQKISVVLANSVVLLVLGYTFYKAHNDAMSMFWLLSSSVYVGGNSIMYIKNNFYLVP